MKVTLAGMPGSGKSTLRAALADRYDLKVKGTGDFMREFAKKHGYDDITDFLVEYVSKHPEVDHEVDEEQKKYGRENDNFVLDAHLGFHFVPDSFKIFLSCDQYVAARRIFRAKRSSEKATDPETAYASTQQRIETMRQNFKKLYNVDIHEESQFDCVIDTTLYTPEKVFELVCDYIDSHS